MEISLFNYLPCDKGAHLEKAKDVLAALGAKNISYLDSGKIIAENCFVSVSHSVGLCAVCVSESPVGIDIEKIEDRDFTRIAEKVFSEREKEYCKQKNSLSAFYEVWTRKEAFAKISGDGIKNIMSGTDTFNLPEYEFNSSFFDGFVMTTCERK